MMYKILVVISFLIIFSLSFHYLIPHDHVGVDLASSMYEAFHPIEREWWVLLVVLFFVSFGLSVYDSTQRSFISRVKQSTLLSVECGTKVFNKILEAFRGGVVKSIVYE